ARKLVNLGARITLIDNLNPLYGGNYFNIKGIEDKVTLIINDIRNIEVIGPYIKNADIIYHFAAQVSYIDSLNMPNEDYSLNAQSTLLILELCRNFNPKAKILFASSRMVLGKVEGTIMTEDATPNPLSLYGIHKLTSEKYLGMYYKDFGIPYVILRITNPYGIRQQIKHSKYSLVGWFIRQAMENKEISIYGNGEQLRDYIYSDDIVNAFILCASFENTIGQIVNIGSGVSTKFKDMVETIVDVVGKGKVKYVPWPKDYEKIETGDIKTDISKIQLLTNWKPAYSLKEGILNTFNYYNEFSKFYL
ncbi:MAG: NAD-dependent epimerase/dehydratase family protein, partial [Bacteroidetes bacterium]|nr:NAD-dependent epimerase/dehydratase family protein [Bacteroidota bacterium]